MNQPSTTDKPSEEIPVKGVPFGDAPAISHGSNTVINPERHLASSLQLPFSDQRSGLSPEISGLWNRLFVIPGPLQTEDSHQGPAGIQLGHFLIEERIGNGGMGAVFRATDLSLQRDVALKILSPLASREDNSVQRFLNEARAAARLDHENIARVFYQGEDHGLNYIAFEYVTGQNIRDMIHQNGLIDPAMALNFTLQIAIALKHTNEAGVVHRDIKPSNVIITPNGRAKLVDLGLARKQNSESVGELTVAGTTLGTFDYISPEQAKDPRTADVRSDIYSLGCTLYHMLTGVPPYPEGTVLQKLLDHQGEETPDPRQINLNIPPVLAEVVKKMMSSQPKNRHANPEELIGDLSFLARGMGLKGLHAESLVWQRPVIAVEKSFWEKHLGWIITVAVLILLVLFIDRFPSSTNTPSVDNNTLLAQDDVNRQKNQNISQVPPIEDNSSSRLPRDDKTQMPSDLTQGPHHTTDDNTTQTDSTKTNSQKPDKITSVDPKEMSTNKTTDETKTEIKPLPIPEKEQPAISIVDGKTYKTLEAACLEAKDGAVIELAFNGKRPGPSEKSIRIANKKITIRAGKNKAGKLFHPLIEFAPTENSATDDLRLVSLINGSIDLYDVNLSVIVNEKIDAENWMLFSMGESEKLRLKGVQLSVHNPGHRNVAIIELLTAPGGEFESLESMAKGANAQPSEFLVKLSESFIRGDCDLILNRHVSSGRFDIEKSIIAIEGTLLKNLGDDLDMPQEGTSLSLQLEHVTAIVGSSLIQMISGDLRRELLSVHVTARNNIFTTNTSSPLVFSSGRDTVEDQRRLIRWQGEKNFYDQFQSFWGIDSEEEMTKSESRNFEGWKQIWSATPESSEVSALNKGLKWKKNNWLDQELADISPDQLALDSTTLDTRTLYIATDGSNIGADLNKFSTDDNTEPKQMDDEDNLEKSERISGD